MACKDDHTRKNIRVERARTGKFFLRGKGRKICTHPFPPLYSRACFGGGMMLASSCNGGGCGTRRQRPCAFDCKCLPCYSTGQCLHELKRKQEGRDTKGTYKRDNSKKMGEVLNGGRLQEYELSCPKKWTGRSDKAYCTETMPPAKRVLFVVPAQHVHRNDFLRISFKIVECGDNCYLFVECTLGGGR